MYVFCANISLPTVINIWLKGVFFSFYEGWGFRRGWSIFFWVSRGGSIFGGFSEISPIPLYCINKDPIGLKWAKKEIKINTFQENSFFLFFHESYIQLCKKNCFALQIFFLPLGSQRIKNLWRTMNGRGKVWVAKQCICPVGLKRDTKIKSKMIQKISKKIPETSKKFFF